MTFFQFIGSVRGAALGDILSLGGQPDPATWANYEDKWLQARMEWLDKENQDNHDPDFHTRMMWLSKSFMNTYWNLVNQLIINPFALSQEEILWSTQHLSQVSNIKIYLFFF